MSKSNLALAQGNPNIGLVQSLYAMFGRGDVDSIVAAATPDELVWSSCESYATVVPKIPARIRYCQTRPAERSWR